MLTYKDCLDMAAVSEDEIDAIARHEGIPALIALELGNRLLETREGTARLRVTFTAAHADDDVARLAETIRTRVLRDAA